MVRDGQAPVGVSTGMMWLLLVNAVLWFVWAVGTGAYPAGAPSLVNGPAAAATLWLLHRDRNERNTTEKP